MEFEAFWDIYLKEDLVKHYDVFKAVFGKALPARIGEEYEVGELLIEFLSQYEHTKEYAKIVEFTEVLATHNPNFLAEVAPYFDEFLITYFCYQGQTELLDAPIQRFLANPLEDYDLLLKSIKLLIYYGHADQVKAIIGQVYPEARDSGKLVAGAERELAMYRFYQELEWVYSHYDEEVVFEWSPFLKGLRAFDFEFKDESLLEDLEEILRRSLWEVHIGLSPAFKYNRTQALSRLGKHFLVYMRGRGVSFATSSDIWENMVEYWEDRRGTPSLQNYFSLRPASFKEYLVKRSGFILDYRFYSAMILWGSTYVYDFLKAAELINETTWTTTQKGIRNLKEELIQEDPDNLWKFSFVHAWGKPESLSEAEWLAEQATFREYHAKLADKKDKPSQTSFFAPSEAELMEGLKRLEQFNPEEDWSEEVPKVVPFKRKLPKIGRNERITVKYTDGRIVQDIKFKKVKADLEAGDCEIIS